MRMTRWHACCSMRMRWARCVKNIWSTRICYGIDVVSGYCWRLLSHPGSSIAEPHLNTRFWQFRPLGELLPRVNIRIMSSLECSFQLIQLMGRKCSPASALFSFQLYSWFTFAIRPRSSFPWEEGKEVLPLSYWGDRCRISQCLLSR